MVAFFNNDDDWHTQTVEFFGDLNSEFVTTEAVIGEVIYFLERARSSFEACNAVEMLLNDVAAGLYDVHFLQKEDLERITNLKIKYADHRRLDYADMTLVMAAEDLNLGEIITIDIKDFQRLRWKGSKHFNVIEPDLKKNKKL